MKTHFTYVWDQNDSIESLLENILKYPNDRHVYNGGPEFEFGTINRLMKHDNINWACDEVFQEKLSQVKQLCEQTPGLKDRIIYLKGSHSEVINLSGDILRKERPDLEGIFGKHDYMWSYLWWHNILHHERASQKMGFLSVKEVMETQPKHLFVCGQHLPHSHRYCAMRVLMETNLIDKGLCTWCNSDIAWKRFCQHLDEEYSASEDTSDIFRQILKNIRNCFPEPFHDRADIQLVIKGYEDYLFDIVVESNFLINFFTEKTFKPLLWGKPFVILGSPENNRVLKSLGFETFPEYFDLSEPKSHNLDNLNHWNYALDRDTELSDRYRQILKPFSDLTQADVAHIHKQVRPKVIHNHDVLVKLFFDDSKIPDYLWDPQLNGYENSINFGPEFINDTREYFRNHEYFAKFCP